MHHFKQMMRQGRGSLIPRYKVPQEILAPLVEPYEVRQ